MSNLPSAAGSRQGTLSTPTGARLDQSPETRSLFDAIRHVDEDEQGEFEWWSAREMMELLGYDNWQNLQNVIERAKAACRNVGQEVSKNFIDASKVSGGRGPAAQDVQLTRFAAYLVAMNGDPRKPEIAAAQRYFAVQTRRAELYLPPVAPPQPARAVLVRPWGERLSLTLQKHRLYIIQNFPPGAFSTYTATPTEILMIEDELLLHQIPMNVSDLPDGSIGQRWSRYRKERAWPDPLGKAPLEMPRLSITVEPFVYSADQRPQFDYWLNSIYIPECMPDYFDKKKNWKNFRLPAASAAERASLRLTGVHAALSDARRRELAAAGGRVIANLPHSLTGENGEPQAILSAYFSKNAIGWPDSPSSLRAARRCLSHTHVERGSPVRSAASLNACFSVVSSSQARTAAQPEA